MIIPNTQKTFLLHLLIEKKEVTENDFNINGYRARLTDLEKKHDLPLKEKWINGKNMFGHTMKFKAHYLEKEDKKEARKLLIKLVAKSKN